MDLFYSELSRERAGSALLYVSFYERLLHFDLLLRQFKYAVFVNLITSLPEKIGNIACSRCRFCGGCLGLLRQTITRWQQYEGCHRREQPLSDPAVIHPSATPNFPSRCLARCERNVATDREPSSVKVSVVVDGVVRIYAPIMFTIGALGE